MRVTVTPSDYTSQVSSAISAWNDAWDGSASEPEFSMSSGTYTLSVTFTGSGDYFCGLGSDGAVDIERRTTASNCGTGRNAEPLTALVPLLLHEIGHAIGYSALDSYAATSECAMNVPSQGTPLNAEICVHEQQLAFWGYEDRDSVDLDLPMIESVALSPQTLDPGDTVWIHPAYNTVGVRPVVAPTWVIDDSTTIARIVTRSGDSVRVAALATGSTTLHVTLHPDPHVVWPAPGSAQGGISVTGPQAPTPCFTAQSASTWQMTDQVFDASCSTQGASIRYGWQFESGGSWTSESASPIYDFAGHATTGNKTVTLKVRDTSTSRDSTTSQTIAVSSGTLEITGASSIYDKSTYPYTATISGTWYEQYPESSPTWYYLLSTYDDSINVVWPAGQYLVNLRAQDSATVLKRGRKAIEVCIDSPGCLLMASMQASLPVSMFGAGPILTWGAGGNRSALEFYQLMGLHTAPSVFARNDWLRQAEGSAATGAYGGGLAWTRYDMENGATYRFTVQPPTNDEYVFGLALDPDLGVSAADDVSGYDRNSGMVYVSDGSKAVGFLLRSNGEDVLAGITQFGTRRFALPGLDNIWQTQRRTGIDLLPSPSDVQFVIAAAPVKGIHEFDLIILEADNPETLIKIASAIR